ncbi:hypothetical protein [Pseudalkalibacillus sp. SCS-8]|uniref:hypothetical protein n=1 Tax=Pseudalkalibacillus nanhaiensis TaxID=3115291 RepID=UPI0032DA3B04
MAKSILLKKVLPLLLIIVIFVFVQRAMTTDEIEPVVVDEEHFLILNTYEEAKFYNRILSSWSEQLEKAEHYDLMKQLGAQEILVLGTKRTIQLHEAWSMHNKIYLLYSVNLIHRDRTARDIPSLEVNKVGLRHDKGDQVVVSAETFHAHPEAFKEIDSTKPFVFDGRVYRGLWIEPDIDEGFATVMDWEQTSKETFQDRLKDVSQITLSQVTLTNHKKSKSHKVKDIPIEMAFSKGDDPITTYEIDKTVQLGEMIAVHIDHLEIGVDGNRLVYNMKPDSFKYNLLLYTMEGNKLNDIPFADEHGESSVRVIDLTDHKKPELSFSIRGALVPSEREYTFRFTEEDIKRYKDFASTNERTLFEEMYSNDTGDNITLVDVFHPNTHDNIHLLFRMRMEEEYHDTPKFPFRDYSVVLEERKNNPTEGDTDPYPYVEVTDKDGERIELLSVWEIMPGHEFGIAMKTEQFIQSGGLSFRLFHFSDRIEFQPNEVKIKLDHSH